MQLRSVFPTGTDARVSQIYGVNPEAYARWPSVPYHNGADITALLGTPLLAVADGQVTRVSWDENGYGLWCEVQHEGFVTRYCHAEGNGFSVEAGTPVTKGEQLLEVGMTGNTSGPHTHFEIRTRDQALAQSVAHYLSSSGRYVIDPFPFLPQPFGDGLPIGVEPTGDYAAEHAARMDQLNDLGDAIRIANRAAVPSATDDGSRLAELNEKYAGRA